MRRQEGFTLLELLLGLGFLAVILVLLASWMGPLSQTVRQLRAERFAIHSVEAIGVVLGVMEEDGWERLKGGGSLFFYNRLGLHGQAQCAWSFDDELLALDGATRISPILCVRKGTILGAVDVFEWDAEEQVWVEGALLKDVPVEEGEAV